MNLSKNLSESGNKPLSAARDSSFRDKRVSVTRNLRQVRYNLCLTALIISFAVFLQGCPLVLLGTAGGGVLVAADPRTLGTQAEDREIQIKAVTQLARALSNEADVHVAVFNRQVLLTGEVLGDADKQKAETVVHAITDVIGGVRIINELGVQGASSAISRLNDASITAKVKASLVHAQDLSANSFKVVTERGTVYLMGLVTSDKGQHAADIASRVPGVLRVIKLLEYIQPQPQ